MHCAMTFRCRLNIKKSSTSQKNKTFKKLPSSKCVRKFRTQAFLSAESRSPEVQRSRGPEVPKCRRHEVVPRSRGPKIPRSTSPLGPRDLLTSGPRDLRASGPRDVGTSAPWEFGTSELWDNIISGLIRILKVFYVLESGDLRDPSLIACVNHKPTFARKYKEGSFLFIASESFLCFRIGRF